LRRKAGRANEAGVPGDESLDRSLSRMRAALARTGAPAAGPMRQGPSPGPAATALGALALALFVAAFLTGQNWLLALAIVAAAAGGILYVVPAARRVLGDFVGHGPPGQAHVGMGATVAADAVLEPGASVEMGATVGSRAVIRSGAVVRMGATVSHDAVVEKGAVVSWGATVYPRTVVGERSIVGAGADVLGSARVPPGMWLRPGSTYGTGSTTSPLPAPQPAAAADPRAARVAAACDKLDQEVRAAPDGVRAFLGGSIDTVASLRRTCEDLARRERELRAEADEHALSRLAEERAALEKRVASERDAQVASSLRGALAAIDEQRRQRELLRVAADRLDAEETRLLYTLEGLASLFVRARNAGVEAGGTQGALQQGVAQLRAELDAIADALEDVARGAPGALLGEAAEPPSAPSEAVPQPRGRTRTS
jgi:carbonic anhydrase/acetyltransferase-like protein (isoleucine patch superfamily)